MSFNAGASTDPILRRLGEVAVEAPELSEAVRLYGVILPLVRDADLRGAPLALTETEVREKMAEGIPLLHELDLEPDWQGIEALLLRLASAVEKAGGRAGPIRQALEAGRLSVAGILPRVVAGEHGPVARAARELDLDAGLLRTLGRNALKPAFHDWRRHLAPLADGIPWDKGFCFVCGSAALLGELRGNAQERHLRCGECGADWAVRRLLCSRCGSEDHTTQRHLYPERGRERMRVELCNACGGYLKTIVTFAPTPPELLPVEDLATLHLDFVAEAQGYARTPGDRRQ
jgi:FdhE protein